jgi:hypothetical protein
MILNLYFGSDTINRFVNSAANSLTHIAIVQEKCLDFRILLVNEDKQLPSSKTVTFDHTWVPSVICVINVIAILHVM